MIPPREIFVESATLKFTKSIPHVLFAKLQLFCGMLKSRWYLIGISITKLLRLSYSKKMQYMARILVRATIKHKTPRDLNRSTRRAIDEIE